jgi:hypothetical protein
MNLCSKSKSNVARVRRRGDRSPPSLRGGMSILEYMRRQGILVFYQWKKRMGVAT